MQTTLPFGTALNAESTNATNKNRFTSYDRSTRTGLDYAVNRSYDSKQGRFTQVDPIGMGASSLFAPQTLNLYTYCGNDPINHTDPSGLFWGFLKSLFKWVIVAIAVIVAVLTIIAAPVTIAGILGEISAAANAASQIANAAGFKKIGAIFGLIAAVTGFGSIIKGKISFQHFLEGSAQQKAFDSGVWFATLGGVGAVSNFAQTKAKKKSEKKKEEGLGTLFCYDHKTKVLFKSGNLLPEDTKNAIIEAGRKEHLLTGNPLPNAIDNGPTNDLFWIAENESEGIVNKRSNNPRSTARGLFQLLKPNYGVNPNGEDSFGNGVEEAQGGIRYIRSRYRTTERAVAFWKANCHY